MVLRAILAAVALVRLWGELPYSNEPLLFRVSQRFLRDFGVDDGLLDGRAPLVPMIFELLNRDPQAIVVAQIGISIAAWSLLAWSTHRFVGGGKRGVIAAALTLLLGASARISFWDRTVMQESVSLSLLALVIAAGLVYDRSERLRDLWLFLIACGLWVLARESNYLGVGMIAAALLFRHARKYRLRHGVTLLGIIGLVVLADWRIDGAGRWVFSFRNVVAHRVLPDEGAVDFMRARGMPVSPALMQMAGKDASADNKFFRNSPELAEWRKWVRNEGRHSYALLLISRPLASLRPLISEFATIFGSAVGILRSQGRTSAGDRPAAPYVAPFGEWLDDLLEWERLSLILLAGSGAAALVSLHPSSRLRLPVFPSLLIVISVPFGLILWHADAMGTARHCLPAAVIQWIGFILVATGARLAPDTTTASQRIAASS